MELELIEPGLFLNLEGAHGAADRFAEAILNDSGNGQRRT